MVQLRHRPYLEQMEEDLEQTLASLEVLRGTVDSSRHGSRELLDQAIAGANLKIFEARGRLQALSALSGDAWTQAHDQAERAREEVLAAYEAAAQIAWRSRRTSP
jgi:hypothetical protein